MFRFAVSRYTWVAVAFMFLTGISSALGQTTYGTVRGLVKDPQGGALVGAAVTLVNEGTKIERKTVANASGEYTFPSVEPGSYSVVVLMDGFKKEENKGISVETGATDTIDLTMQLGGASETVEVTTSEPLINTANANGGQSFDSTQLQELPNLGRNPFVFEKLDAAVTPVGG
jgi:hypothetical protein